MVLRKSGRVGRCRIYIGPVFIRARALFFEGDNNFYNTAVCFKTPYK
jgi:hypothetical protein